MDRFRNIALMWLVVLGVSCVSTSDGQNAGLVVEDLPRAGLIKVTNSSARDLNLYYFHNPQLGDLQMFMVRFRDRGGRIVDINGAEDGWFTPGIYSSTAYFNADPPRRLLRVSAGQSVEFERRLTEIAYQVLWAGPAVEGPCEVQLQFFGYLENNTRRRIEAFSDWQPGPCPS